MNELQIFNNQEFGNVRGAFINDEPWMVAKDVATALGYSNPQKAIRDHVDPEDKGVNEMFTPGGKQKVHIINESGLYSLILGSKLEGAKRFKHWVTSEVLPAIRKNGSYTAKKNGMTEYQERMIASRAENARIQRARILMEMAKSYEGSTYEQVLHANATKELTGEFLLPLPKLEAKTYSASEIGAIVGCSKEKVGRLANLGNLKTSTYGQWFKDKASHADKEVNTFRYYETVIPVLKMMLGQKV